MDIIMPFVVGLVAIGIIWTTATVLDKKRLNQKEKEVDESLYHED